MPSTAIKRLADESSELGHKAQKLSHKSTPGGASARTKEKERQIVPRSQIKETDHQEGVCVQVGKYLFEQFSIPAIRPHATVGLADRNRIQFYHPNHSVILISSAINFGPIDEADGLDKLIAIVIASSRLSPRHNCTPCSLNCSKLFQDVRKLSTTSKDPSVLWAPENNELGLKKDGQAAERVQSVHECRFGGLSDPEPFPESTQSQFPIGSGPDGQRGAVPKFRKHCTTWATVGFVPRLDL